MNQRLSSHELEGALAAKLKETLDGIPGLAPAKLHRNPAQWDRAFDIRAVVPLPDEAKAELWVECKADPRPSQFPYVTVARGFEDRRLSRVRIQVLGVPHMSPTMAKVCEEHGWSWFDLAGNCRLSVPGSLLVERTGRPALHRPVRRVANLGTGEAGRVVRVLLAPDNAGRRWTQRDMQLHVQPNVSLGLVNKVVRYLRDERFVEQLDDGGFRLKDPVGLLAAWREAYRFGRHLRRDYFTLLHGRQLRDALADLDIEAGGQAAYAVFSAAELQAPHVRQPKTWLFVAAEHLDALATLAQAKPVDSGENLIVLIPSDPGVFYAEAGSRMVGQRALPCTNPVQTYLDLWSCGSRGGEAAAALLEQCLEPAWKRGAS